MTREPGLARELGDRLAVWAGALPTRTTTAETVDLDDETVARLQALGYLA